MSDIEERIKLAKKDSKELNQLIHDYIPFLKKAASDFFCPSFEFDDKYSIAMLTFLGCIKQYEVTKGNFISFASKCIKNRYIDEYKKIKRNVSTVPISEYASIEDDTEYFADFERELLQAEIAMFKTQLSHYDISFQELSKIHPKQERARKQCFHIAKQLIADDDLCRSFLKTQKLPRSELASLMGLSVKTLEKHRKYIVTVALLLLGDYPSMQSFIPMYKYGKE